MKTLIIFDIDGTLLFSNRLDSQCFAESYQQIFDRPFPSIDWAKYDHVTDHTIFNSVYKDHFNQVCTPERIGEFQDAYIALMHQKRKLWPNRFMEVPNASATLKKLGQSDTYVIGIATGGWKRPAIYKLDYIGVDYNNMYCSFADHKETRDEILQESITKATAYHDVDKVVYVGDAIWDVHTTNRMNIPMIGIRRAGDHQVLSDAGIQHVLTDYNDYDRFLSILDSI